MANVYIRDYPAIPDLNSIKIGEVPRGSQWENAARVHNWVQACGAQLVPACFPNCTLSPSTNYKFQFRVRPSLRRVRYVWSFTVRPLSGRCTVTSTVTAGTSEQNVFAASDRTSIAQYDDPTAFDSTPATKTIQFNTTSTAVVESIALYEADRPALTDIDDKGIVPTLFAPGQRIQEYSSGTDFSKFVQYSQTSNRYGLRSGHFAWAVPYEVGGSESTTFAVGTTATSGAPDSFFGLDVPVLARAVDFDVSTGANATTRNINFYALVKNSDGATAGSLRATATSGGTGTNTIQTSHTTWTWRSTTFAVDTEDTASVDGRRSTRWDDISFDFWRSSGTGTVYCAAIVLAGS